MTQKEPNVVRQWCPECDRMRNCEVIGRYMIECRSCYEPIPMSAENGRKLGLLPAIGQKG